ncbi:MAG: CooT family nickel-binding protein [Bacillota bacterium]
MCESNVFMASDGREDLIMEAVDIIKTEGAELFLQGVLGDTIRVKGRIKELRLMEHKIIVEPQ